ncbi:N-acetylglucosamine kinase-like BadF-type ATPase [Actinoalloteichus hoggarensis]|uniref:BadF/BadG/BcrA/BcrD ATPase family protein n=1 Tax=Actinoalloteichus hoggarensis TaxID=1470176 RepID=A0A221VWV0_9PSEU|nr:BadF/BadG/BcrA/BcrD ATPase family protein [Actinoalloteichus hoggarensis]ASO18029.1 BadF/BadG/BcrA/BcrD ATPase family protein [Actinoalloteichus hoggarensis]MBB5921383.1 N-acetylglucosamine kinase-like BadF-type ATPase [Actinoalloteichus hoggarensis]
MADPRDLVIGVDIGGTSTTAVLASADGRRHAWANGEGANPNAHPVDVATARLTEVLRELLTDVDAGRVSTGVLGMAGVSRLSDPAVDTAFQQAWAAAAGPAARLRVLSDVETAFAAGTPAATGVVLIAGTGAIAARIERNALHRISGGHGWLLGDEGSAFWLGREAVRHTLRAVEGADRPGELTDSVLDAALGAGSAFLDGSRTDGETRRRLIASVNSAPPVRLAEYAPLVSAACLAGDPAARKIVRRGATELATLVRRLRTSDDTSPVILAGSLLTSGSPLEAEVRAELADSADVLSEAWVDGAPDAATGAAWLAVAATIDDPTTARQVHRRLTERRTSVGGAPPEAWAGDTAASASTGTRAARAAGARASRAQAPPPAAPVSP